MSNGRAINYSGAPLVVIYQNAGSRVGNVLQDSQMTPDSVEPEIIFHLEFDDNVIRGHHYGWNLESGCLTYVYRRSTDIVWFGPIEHDLHCIPTDITRLDPAYSKATASDLGLVVIDSDPSWGVFAPAPELRDGFNQFEWTNIFDYRFGPLVSRYMRTGLNVTMRLKLLPSPYPYPEIPAADLDHIHQAIVEALSQHWNKAAPPTGSASRMVFRVELIEENEDHVVELKFDPQRLHRRCDSDHWWQDITAAVVTHELGHVLGLIDEYYLYDNDDPKHKGMTRSSNPAANWKQERAAEQEDYPGRYEQRVKTGNCDTSRPPNVMESPQTTLIDASLVDSIYTASNKQILCFR
jgi:hypothetical protein